MITLSFNGFRLFFVEDLHLSVSLIVIIFFLSSSYIKYLFYNQKQVFNNYFYY